MKKLCFFMLIFIAGNLYAQSTTERVGDVLQIVLPVTAYATTLYLDDDTGQMQFYKSFGTTLATTYLFKYTVREKRPDSSNTDSFPSGHTSSAFAGASFIHMRYGLKYAILPYMAAVYTGYSRIYANRHHPVDVYAGAAIAIVSSWYFVSPWKGVQVTPLVEKDVQGVRLSYQW